MLKREKIEFLEEAGADCQILSISKMKVDCKLCEGEATPVYFTALWNIAWNKIGV